MEQILKQW